jgi:hypothetical protein
MTIKATMPTAVDVNEKWLYKASGIFGFALGLLFIIELGLGVALGKLPGSSGLAWLSFVNDKSGSWSALIYVTVISDLLFLFVYLSLYSALRSVSRGLMLIAAVCAVFGTVLDEVIANANFASLLTLGGQYAGAGTAAQRAADVAAADYGAALLSSHLEEIFAFVIPGVALVLIGIVMLRSPFGRRVAYLGIAAGVFDLLQVTHWDLVALINTVLQAIWFVLVGRCLYFRYAAPAPAVPAGLSEDFLSV